MVIKRLKSLANNSGITLFLIRLPFRFLKYLFNRLNTLFYKSFLKECGPGTIIEFGAHIESPNRVSLGSNVYIGRKTIINSENTTGTLSIENNVHIGTDCHIDHTGLLVIKANTLISEKVFIYTHSHGYDPRSLPDPIDKTIEENVWIGSQAVVLESSAKVAKGIILAANSVATKQLTETNGIYAGLPAKLIKKYDS
jgi:acetyltransferase-like isoleucine patch superfamily enzyme